MTLFSKKREKRKKQEHEMETAQLEEIAAEISAEIEKEMKSSEKIEQDSETQSLDAKKMMAAENGQDSLKPQQPKEEVSDAEQACQQIKEARRQSDEAKLEYQAVTEYLTDIQKIDRLEGEARQIIEDAARNIITLTRERSKYQASDVKLSDVQFRHIARYADEMDKELKRMKENEEYDRKVRGDMRKLDASITSLKYEKEDLEDNQASLKRLGLIAFGLISVMALILVYLSYRGVMDMKVPFIGTCVLAIGAAFYIFYEARKNNYEYVMNGKKLNKAISLLNTVKIKFVNNKNALDYQYGKFMVSGYDELLKLWERYSAAQREAEKYKSNTGLLNYNNNKLVGELRKQGIQDCDVWIYQAAALIDSREMVEIRHRLNARRQSLRERIDFNYESEKTARNNLDAMQKKNPEQAGHIDDVMKQYDVE